MTTDRLDNTDLGVLDAALDLLERQGDWQQVTDIGRLREKLDRMGVRNVVPWGRDLSVHLSEQVDLVGKGERDLDHFIAEIDTGYPDGRDPDRNDFLEAVKELARKCAPRREGMEKNT
ncbi:hypothetical protein G6L37_35080 [Agrobacterium rubi]|nr:hypothetical protein [Agrobacterium rubi]NTF23794.1 hypothetical protein [Agrobacterium rubi]